MDFETDEERRQTELKEMEAAAKRFNKILRYDGSTRDKELIKEILRHTNRRRQIIKSKYVDIFKQYLEVDLKNTISGDFLTLVLALLKERYEYEAGFMNEAIAAIGSDERLIIQMLCTKDAKSLQLLKDAYKNVFGRDFQQDIKKQDGDFNNLYYYLASGSRAENHGYDTETVYKDAQELVNASSIKGKIDEKVFIKILSTRSFPQLHATFSIYYDIANVEIDQVLKKNAKGNFLLACLTIIKCARSKPKYFADELNRCIAGPGTNDKDLIRIIVTRCDSDLSEIKMEYEKKYDESLYKAVKGDTSGSYQELLLAIIGK